MSREAILLETIEIEEIPLHVHLNQTSQALQPAAIEEDQDDARSLLYLFDDNDFERAAAFLAIEEARQQAEARAHAAAEALIEAETQRQRTQTLAGRLRQLMDEDDELIDMLGRRLLATRGYQVSDLWNPQHYHHHHHQHLRASPSRGEDVARAARSTDVYAAWSDLADQTGLTLNHRPSPFIHAAPVFLRGHAPYQPRARKSSKRVPLGSVGPSSATTAKIPARTQTRVAVHPLTGIPMLFFEETSDTKETGTPPSSQPTTASLDDQAEGDFDAWPIDDESDLDWLGRELLHRQGGADVWILGTDDGIGFTEPTSTAAAAPTTSSTTDRCTSTNASESIGPILPVHVEEADSDHDTPNVASEPALSSPSHRVAAALAQAALRSTQSQQPASPSSQKTGQTRKQRSATIMSESEEEELETVGRPVVEEEQEQNKAEASSLDDRPRKTVKVMDVR
ncbi:timeless protein [Pseudozyma hubeiensis SY62]|uniref:Timeless protein n=1 Tax=Pseudozyma hubeiensis (strain SY62) TaxID=1305764 RepID=R9PM42_PSEHS|nr:timeless protein [Pseudozyma hubeiensis SY62]GAC99195.1 timeless protein [Pseudozyma hubeiensis SY62]